MKNALNYGNVQKLKKGEKMYPEQFVWLGILFVCISIIYTLFIFLKKKKSMQKTIKTRKETKENEKET
jgi:preprotein translocase subunit SecG